MTQIWVLLTFSKLCVLYHTINLLSKFICGLASSFRLHTALLYHWLRSDSERYAVI